EVCFLDISASLEKRGTLVALVERVARELSIPFAVGGGVRTVSDAEALLRAGADKVSLNSAALADPALLTGVARLTGSQSALVATVFHFGSLSVAAVKEECAKRGFPMRWPLEDVA